MGKRSQPFMVSIENAWEELKYKDGDNGNGLELAFGIRINILILFFSFLLDGFSFFYYGI